MTQPSFRPLRLLPGADLRLALEALGRDEDLSAFIVCGIGSLGDAHLRLADANGAFIVPGPVEILTLSGSLSPSGAHLHIAVADASGRVVGGHVLAGNLVHTTAELLLAPVPGWRLSRAQDAATGYAELRIERDDKD